MDRYHVYRRVSTDEQAESGAGLDAQWDRCDQAIPQGSLILGPYDDDLSGATPVAKRPGLQRLFTSAQPGDVLLVAKRDRLGRDRAVLLELELEVKLRGLRVRSAAGEGTEHDDAASRLLRGIVDLFAEYERWIISERTTAALAGRKARGRRVGTVPYGYQLDDDGTTLEPCPAELATLERMERLRTAGASYRSIAATLDGAGARARCGRRFSPSTVSYLLSRADNAP